MSMSGSAFFDWEHQSWRDQAACLHTDPDRFFPAGNTGEAIDQIRAAKAVCEVCPVQGACLQFALETNQEAGIWGGKDEIERRRLRKAWRAGRRTQAAGVDARQSS